MKTLPHLLLASLALPLLWACDGAPNEAAPEATASEDPAPQTAWWNHLQSLCGNAYSGELVAYDEEADQGWREVEVIMHVRQCSDSEIRIPLHVGENRSRTWVLSRTDEGIQLAHDHRHPDGSPEVLHLYGGETDEAGSEHVQRFPANDYSRQLFIDEDIPDSAENTWRMEIHPGERFTYGLRRFNRDFQVDFDLNQPVEAPPAPWVVQPEETSESD